MDGGALVEQPAHPHQYIYQMQGQSTSYLIRLVFLVLSEISSLFPNSALCQNMTIQFQFTNCILRIVEFLKVWMILKYLDLLNNAHDAFQTTFKPLWSLLLALYVVTLQQQYFQILLVILQHNNTTTAVQQYTSQLSDFAEKKKKKSYGPFNNSHIRRGVENQSKSSRKRDTQMTQSIVLCFLINVTTTRQIFL